MTAKKRWFRKSYPETQENSQVAEISWSSSDSDEQSQNLLHCIKIKKKKLENTSPSLELNTNKYPSTALLEEFEESPILTGLKLEELSPPLFSSHSDEICTKDTSPIIGKRDFLKNVRSRYKNQCQKVKMQVFRATTNTSPEIFPDKESPNTMQIEPFPSQNSSQIIINCNTDSSSKTDPGLLYHQPPPKKKKFKKAGLAWQLDKVLQRKRTRISIWQHESYLNKASEAEALCTKEEIVFFLVKSSWTEYGNVIFECEFLQENPDNCGVFLIVLGCCISGEAQFKINCRYKLFPPYSIKSVNYQAKVVNCYLNVSKYLLYK